MGYLDIENLHRSQDILRFRECYALEKIHGSSAHIAFKDGSLRFFAGGASHEAFVRLFDQDVLLARFAEMGHPETIVYGEAYGGKCQGMKHVYGASLRFVAFDVRVGYSWLAVPQAADVAAFLGLEFVAYDLIPTTLEALDAHKALPSVQAVRNGCGIHEREGDVLRSPIEVRKNNGERIIAKYKNDSYIETTRPHPVDPDKQIVLAAADAIADHWVTPMRLVHVLDALRANNVSCTEMSDTGLVVRAMTADVYKEAATGEIVWSKDAEQAIGKKTAKLFKALVHTVPAR